MSTWMDRIVGVLKWPVAVIGLISLPALGWSLFEMMRALGTAKPLLPFLGGFVLYLLLWYGGLNRPAYAGFFTTMEHELTHAIFAWLTLHRVVGFRGTWRSGGHVRYLGKGNWLITIAPFVIPLFSLAVAVLLALLPHHLVRVGSVLLGVTLAYHATATWSRDHRHHGDLREVGTLFWLTFVPAATLLVYGLLISFIVGGGPAMKGFLHHAFGHFLGFGRMVWHWIT